MYIEAEITIVNTDNILIDHITILPGTYTEDMEDYSVEITNSTLSKLPPFTAVASVGLGKTLAFCTTEDLEPNDKVDASLYIKGTFVEAEDMYIDFDLEIGF